MMLGYRIWGLAAVFIGYMMTGFIAGFLGLNISDDDLRLLGLVVGFAIYFTPILISNNNKKKAVESLTNSNLTENDMEKIKPFVVELFQRVEAGENLETVAKSIATRAKVKYEQVITFGYLVAENMKKRKE